MLRRLLPLSLLCLIALVGGVVWAGSTPDRPTDRPAGPLMVDAASTSPGPTPRQVEPPTTTTIDPCAGGAGLPPDRVTDVPPELAARVGPATDALFATADQAGVSIWVEGIGEVGGAGRDQPLLPASNQKLITAIGVDALLDGDHRFVTEVVAAGPVVDGTLDGDLVLVAGGDPTLTRVGPHSLAELAGRVRAAGVSLVTGGLVVDAGRHGPA
ncbi:MAG: D-alanyl-D-alanine carboxypeptidase, partial [Actinomycetota bacterium]